MKKYFGYYNNGKLVKVIYSYDIAAPEPNTNETCETLTLDELRIMYDKLSHNAEIRRSELVKELELVLSLDTIIRNAPDNDQTIGI